MRWATTVYCCFHSLSGLCGFYTFRIFENQSNPCGVTAATCWLLDYQTMAGEMVRPIVSVLTAWQCTLRLDFHSEAATRHAATLDTWLVAKRSSDGSRPQLFSNHFQYALARLVRPLWRPHWRGVRIIGLLLIIVCQFDFWIWLQRRYSPPYSINVEYSSVKIKPNRLESRWMNVPSSPIRFRK